MVKENPASKLTNKSTRAVTVVRGRSADLAQLARAHALDTDPWGPVVSERGKMKSGRALAGFELGISWVRADGSANQLGWLSLLSRNVTCRS